MKGLIYKIKALLKIILITCSLFVILIAINGARILLCKNQELVRSDAIIVLGAGGRGSKPSPVFRERINHAVNLYKQGYSRFIIFTGGRGFLQEPGEAVIAKNYAVKKGVPIQSILIENMSKNTYENLLFAKYIADKYNLKTFIIVSDPYHLKRAMEISEDIGLISVPSSTPTTRFISFGLKAEFLFKESYYLLLYETEMIVKNILISR